MEKFRAHSTFYASTDAWRGSETILDHAVLEHAL